MKELLKKLNACEEAIEWVADKSLEEAWRTCERGDWMLWFAKKMNIDDRELTLAKGKCAELAIYLMKDQRSKDAVKAAIAYGERRIDRKELADAAAAAAYAAAAADATYAAADATYATAADAAAYAAYAAYAAADADADADAAAYAYAAYAAYAAADAAAYAAYAAADAAADAAYAYAAYAAYAKRKEILAKCADICRQVITLPTFEKV